MKGCATTSSMENLNDELLLEILWRLPCYSTAVRCKAVSKRWRSLISYPLFATQGFLMHRETKVEQNQSWALLLTMKMRDDHLVTNIVTPPHSIRKLRSPVLSMDFMPFSYKIVASFRDLVLCFRVDPLTQVGMFVVCNPLTKQWMTLPPSETHHEPVLYSALVRHDEGAFRVIAVHSIPSIDARIRVFRNYKLAVYLSETGQWKDVTLRIKYQPFDKLRIHAPFAVLVYKAGMVCLSHNLYIGAFNPFDVTPSFSGTLTAIPVPWPAVDGKLLESNGKLVAVKRDIDLRFKLDENLAEPLRGWMTCELGLNPENDEQTNEWEKVSVMSGGIRLIGSISAPRGVGVGYHHAVVAVHPNKAHLLYFLIKGTNQLLLCDTKSQTLELVMRLPAYDEFVACHRLELPCWPTPIIPQNH
ncbi:hypothetical protein vseg_014923 [Gypsophila vaccaria]